MPIRTDKGISLDNMARTYDLITPAEKSRFRKKQIALACLREGESVLEVGCGTAPLSLLARSIVGPRARVAGIDLAPRMLAQAQRKARDSGLSIDFQAASIDALPFRHGSFDVVLSSMMLHHLPVAVKRGGLAEIHRVLRPGGRFFLSDFCSPHVLTLPVAAVMFLWTEATRFQFMGRLPALVRECGFRDLRRVKKGLLLEHYLATKSE